MAEPSTGDYHWLIVHHTVAAPWHPAWYQRAVMLGDFESGRRPLPNYVLRLDGTTPAPTETPSCGTCGAEPETDELNVVERATGKSNFLAPLRDGTVPWDRVGHTRPETCYVCNSEGEQVPGVHIALCRPCEANLSRGGM